MRAAVRPQDAIVIAGAGCHLVPCPSFSNPPQGRPGFASPPRPGPTWAQETCVNTALIEALEAAQFEAHLCFEELSTPKKACIEQLKRGYRYKHIIDVLGNLILMAEGDKHEG